MGRDAKETSYLTAIRNNSRMLYLGIGYSVPDGEHTCSVLCAWIGASGTSRKGEGKWGDRLSLPESVGRTVLRIQRGDTHRPRRGRHGPHADAVSPR
jgi:hypothetical protein